MRTLIALTAVSLVFGQVAAPMGASTLGGLANVSAVGMMGYILYVLVAKTIPEAREHTERVVDKLVVSFDRRMDQTTDEHRRDREQFAAAMGNQNGKV